jgi:MFS family permease
MDTRVLVLGAARMADALGNSFLIVVLPLYVASGMVEGNGLGGLTEPVVAGLVLGLFGLVSSAAQPLAGRLSDRAGKRKLFVLLGLVIFGFANWSFALVDSYVGLLAVRALQGLAASLTITAGVALVSELSTFGTRGGNMGIYNSLRLIGFGIGPLMAGLVVEAGPYPVPGLDVPPVDGFTASFAIAALAAMVSAVLVWWFVEDPEETQPTSERMAVRFLARDPDRTLDPIFTLGLATFIMAGCIALLSPIEPQLNERLGQGPFMFAVEFSTLIAALAVFQPVIGRASDRVGRKTFIVLGMIGLAPTTLAQGLVLEPWQMVVARLLQGVSAAAVFAPGLALAGDLSKEGQTGAQLSVLTVSFGLGISLAQIAAGYLVRYGIPAPFIAGAALALLGVAAVQTQVVEAEPGRNPGGAGRGSPPERRGGADEEASPGRRTATAAPDVSRRTPRPSSPADG